MAHPYVSVLKTICPDPRGEGRFPIRRIMIKAAAVFALIVLALSLGITHASSAEISRSVQGGITINILPIQASADVDRNGIVDQGDLAAVTKALGVAPAGDARVDINHDGIVDVVDLAIVGQYLGEEVPV